MHDPSPPLPSDWKLTTARLELRPFTPVDAPFLRELMNQPSYHRFIGDRGVRSDADAVRFMEEKILTSYRNNGYSLFLVSSLDDGRPVGANGFLKREHLDAPDLGFAFLDREASRGFGYESSTALLRWGFGVKRFPRVYGITDPENVKSQGLLRKLGFAEQGTTDLPGYAGPSSLFVRERKPEATE